MKKAIFGIIFILWGLCVAYLIFLGKRQKQKNRMKLKFQRVFSRDPDPLTLQKWISVQKKKPDFFKNYVRKVEESSGLSQNETIVFVGLIRNNGNKTIQFWTPLIDTIGLYFKDYKVIFVENDSEDDTRREILSLVKKNEHYDIFCPGENTWNQPSCVLGFTSVKNRKEKNKYLDERLSILSQLRESYTTQIMQMENVDYVMMIDWDLQGDFSLDGFFHGLSLLRDSSIDGVAVNSFHRKNNSWLIFDTFPLFSPHQCREIVRNPGALDKLALKKYNKTFLEAIHPLHIPSAFGGMAIYKHASLLKKNPHYISDRCPYQCEHSVFQENLKMVLDPWFIFLIYKNMH